MNYLVSTNNEYELSNYKKVASVQEVTEANANSIILLHSFQEESYKASLMLSNLYSTKGVNKFIYINESPFENVKVLIDSLKGVVEEDESLLQDEDEIEGLVEVLKEDSLEIAVGETDNQNSPFKVLNEFVSKLTDGDESLNDPLYLDVVNRALSSINRDMELQEERISLMGKGVIESYNNTRETINILQGKAEEVKNQLLEIKHEKKYGNANRNRASNLSFYPPIIYTGSTPLIVFKEMSACRYLTSMVLAYKNHLETVKNKRVRLIVVTGKQELLRERYEGFFELTVQTMKTEQAIVRDVAFTTTPLKDLMTYMTQRHDEVILILDRTYEKEPIFTNKSKVIPCVASLGELRKYNLNHEECIMSLRGMKNTLMRLTHLDKYPTGRENRLDRYEREFYNDFNRIDDYLGIRK
ncbi:hypothetical protein ACQUY5_28345 [Bacillus cereus]|uniref:hypothetical protein n=1 Tax=Bacillus cereus TaxID=1396 RepID=UPI003D171CC5